MKDALRCYVSEATSEYAIKYLDTEPYTGNQHAITIRVCHRESVMSEAISMPSPCAQTPPGRAPEESHRCSCHTHVQGPWWTPSEATGRE